MTEKDGYDAPLATITYEQFHNNRGIDTDPGYENIINDPDIIPQQVDIYGFYTSTNFYYCLVVNDLVHYNNGHENLYSGGDSVFFNMVGDVDATDDSSRNRYCMRITNDGIVDVHNYSENVFSEVTDYDKWLVTRDEDTKLTTYEIVVPFDDILFDTDIDVGDWFYFQEGLELSKNEEYTNDHCMTTPPGKNTTRNWWKMIFAGEAPTVEESVVEEPVAEAPEEIVEVVKIAEPVEETVVEAPVIEEPIAEIVIINPSTADGIIIATILSVISLGGASVLKKRA